MSSSPRLAGISSNDDDGGDPLSAWAERFRRVQEHGAKSAVQTDLDVEDVPQTVRRALAVEDSEGTADAERLLAAALEDDNGEPF